jgi:hypothetical protein
MNHLLVIIFWLMFSSPVNATEPKYRAPEKIPCWEIKGYIWMHGQDKAYAWATARYTSDQIDAVRKRCSLKWNG